ncbi:FAD-binding domain-containing protein, partial [Thozetella sp. PMI_491]
CRLPAGCILKPQNAIEVAIVLKLATFFNVKFAVRSGGHMQNAGFGSIGSTGVLFDLSLMNKIALSEDQSTVSVGPAATWDAVYGELEKHELTAVGGRVKEVGVGGFLLGGGMSHFSNHWGMGCDNVKSYEVVLADSSVVVANSSQNHDLFSALKGGGPNLGIVTRFELYTHSDYKLWYNLKSYSVDDAEPVMGAVVKTQEAMDTDDRIGFFITVDPASFVVATLYRGKEPAPGVFSAFASIKPTAELIPATLGTQYTLCQMLLMPVPFKGNSATMSIRPDAKLYTELHQLLRDGTNGLPPSVSSNFTIQPLGRSAVKKGQESGGNIMNIPSETHGWIALVIQSTDEKDLDLTLLKTQEIIKKFMSAADQRSNLFDFLFMNDSPPWQSPLKGYGPKGVTQLTAAAKKWDPTGVFQSLQNSGFLL